MISFLQHQADVLALQQSNSNVAIEPISVTAAHGRIVANDVCALLPVPRFSNSAMDGFAVLRSDIQQGQRSFPVSADVPAGTAPKQVPAGHAVRIMTGAPVVETQADLITIIPVEDTNIPSGPVELPAEIVVNKVSDKNHIRFQGESCAVDDVVIRSGSVIDAGAIASLVSVGATTINVVTQPQVAVVSSGNELRQLGQQLAPWHIPDSNTLMIADLVRSVSPAQVTTYHLGDDPDSFSEQLFAIAASVDLIITTGGVSAGAFDVVKASLSRVDSAQVEFRRLAMQPGKPQGFGQIAGQPIVCLPGNPVSAFVSFHLFVRPLLAAMCGKSQPQELAQVELCVNTELQTTAGRDLFVPCRIDWSQKQAQVTIPGGKGSHFVASLAGVTGIIHLPASQKVVASGKPVMVYLL